uniref:Uncharacterized protein n=1 Tax=Oryza barthii TaxID=65489 RepID=A0A0D3HV46_9ORYZ
MTRHDFWLHNWPSRKLAQIASQNPTPEPLPLLFSSLPLRRRLALLSSPPHFSLSAGLVAGSHPSHATARPHPHPFTRPASAALHVLVHPLCGFVRHCLAVQQGSQSSSSWALRPVAIASSQSAHNVVTRPIQLEVATGAVHPLSSRRDTTFFRLY